MNSKKSLLKKIFTIILFFNSLIIIAQENDTINKVWNNQDYATFSEKAIYDCYKLKANKSRLNDRIDLLFKNNKIDENKYNEYKKRIENEEDILVKNYKDEIDFEISEMKKFCETNIVNLYYTSQEKKIEYILQKIQQDFSSLANHEKKYLETKPIYKPKSLPNNGSDVSWSIEDYDDFVKSETENCPNLLTVKKTEAQEKLDRAINKLKSDKYKNELNKISVNENEFKQSINNLKDDFEKEIESLKDFCEKQIEKNTKYRDEWVAYLKAKPIYDNIANEISKAKLEAEEENRKKRVEFDEAEKVKKNKIAEELYKAKTMEILNSTEYKNWKTKYLSIIKSADANILIMNNLEKKYSFRNNFGNLVWDSNSFTKQDKITYNKNYDAIAEKLNSIKELQKIGDNEKYLNYYENSVISSKTNGIELYSLSQYYSTHERLY